MCCGSGLKGALLCAFSLAAITFITPLTTLVLNEGVYRMDGPMWGYQSPLKTSDYRRRLNGCTSNYETTVCSESDDDDTNYDNVCKITTYASGIGYPSGTTFGQCVRSDQCQSESGDYTRITCVLNRDCPVGLKCGSSDDDDESRYNDDDGYHFGKKGAFLACADHMCESSRFNPGGQKRAAWVAFSVLQTLCAAAAHFLYTLQRGADLEAKGAPNKPVAAASAAAGFCGFLAWVMQASLMGSGVGGNADYEHGPAPNIGFIFCIVAMVYSIVGAKKAFQPAAATGNQALLVDAGGAMHPVTILPGQEKTPPDCCYKCFCPPCAVMSHQGCDEEAGLVWVLCCIAWLPAWLYAQICWEPKPMMRDGAVAVAQGQASYVPPAQGNPVTSQPARFDPQTGQPVA